MTVRWPTYEPGIPEEVAGRAELEQRIDNWWQAFERQSKKIDEMFRGAAERWDLPGWMHATLQAIDPRLMWEYGPALNKKGHRLVITPESDHHLRPLTAEILARAPELDGWEFHGYRPAESVNQLSPTLEGRTGKPWQKGVAACTPGEGNRVDVLFQFPRKLFGRNQDLEFSQAFVTCETLLGEDALDHWIGAIEVETRIRDARPIEELHSAFGAARQRVLEENTPSDPLWKIAHDVEWTLYELKPNPAPDFPRQLDLFLGKSMAPTLWMTAHSDLSFSSSRFSRFDELFCYLKVDGSEGLDDSIFGDKGDIEDALDEALRPGGLGGVIGGGTGLRYSYVDLSLSDLQAAIPAIRQALRDGRIPHRSWIQFFDDDWQSEWVGIWQDTPPPPMVESADA